METLLWLIIHSHQQSVVLHVEILYRYTLTNEIIIHLNLVRCLEYPASCSSAPIPTNRAYTQRTTSTTSADYIVGMSYAQLHVSHKPWLMTDIGRTWSDLHCRAGPLLWLQTTGHSQYCHPVLCTADTPGGQCAPSCNHNNRKKVLAFFAIRRMQCCPEMLHYEQVTCSRTREDVTVKLGCY